MIIRIFSAGKSRGESPVNYLLSNNDHTGATRCVKPEILDGNPKTTIDIINSIGRDWKYVSGAIAFRNNEQPTPEQISKVIDSFKQTFCAGLNKNQFNSLFVLHKDKGNHEIHFVVPMIELTTGKRLNIHPPGSKNIELYQAFTKVINHELGYAQVLQDPLKITLPGHKLKSPEFKNDQRKNILLEKEIKKAIISGKVENRTQLCKFLDEELGVSIHRQGKDYISIRLSGDQKSRRLKGPMFEENANYREMLEASRKTQVSVKLTDTEYQHHKNTLTELTNERATFNSSVYSNARPVRLGMPTQSYKSITKLAPIKTITKEKTQMANTDYLPIMKRIILEALIEARKKPAPANPIKVIPNIKTTMNSVASIRKKALGGTPSPANLNLDALKMTIAEVETNLHEAIGEMNAARDPIDAARLNQRVIQLKIQLEKLHAEVMALQIKFGLSANKLKPK